jgi:hypothetical protein
MSWSDVVNALIAVTAALGGALISAVAVLRAGSQAIAAQTKRGTIASRREFAWRKQMEVQPTLDAIVRSGRRCNEACVTPGRLVSNDEIAALDAAIDRLETSGVTFEVASAAIEMRIRLVQYQSVERMKQPLADQMPHSGEPLRPDIGQQLIKVSEQSDDLRDKLLAAVYETRKAVQRLSGQFEREQRGEEEDHLNKR